MSTHITRYDKEYSSFNGWRLCITRLGQKLVRYFSDLEYGSAQKAKEEALACREMVYTQLNAHPNEADEVLRQLNKRWQSEQHPHALPKHLHPATATDKIRKSLTLRITPLLHELLQAASIQLGIDTSSVLRLAVYHYLATIADMPSQLTPAQLQEHLKEMETHAAAANLPPFETLMFRSDKRQE